MYKFENGKVVGVTPPKIVEEIKKALIATIRQGIDARYVNLAAITNNLEYEKDAEMLIENFKEAATQAIIGCQENIRELGNSTEYEKLKQHLLVLMDEYQDMLRNAFPGAKLVRDKADMYPPTLSVSLIMTEPKTIFHNNGLSKKAAYTIVNDIVLPLNKKYAPFVFSYSIIGKDRLYICVRDDRFWKKTTIKDEVLVAHKRNGKLVEGKR